MVSIPNGIEFYFTRSIKLRLQKKFQFPMGWNSTFHHLAFKTGTAFQFPTGWNSTKLFGNTIFHMNKFQFPTGWNSTVFDLVLDENIN